MSDRTKYALIGLAAIVVLLAVKIGIEKTAAGHWVDRAGFQIVHGFLSPYELDKDLPVVVLDISDLKREQGVTDTDQLKEIVTALVESKAKAIAINLNFSPREPQPEQEHFDTFGRADGDQEFFDFLKKQNVPVFLGAYDPGVESETWLGLDEYKDLAAVIDIDPNDPSEVPTSIECDGQTTLYSIGKGVASTATASQTPVWLAGLLYSGRVENASRVNNSSRHVACRTTYTLVNYSKLRLIQQTSLQTLDKASILLAKDLNGTSRFRNKLVVIGNGQLPKTKEPAFVPPYGSTPTTYVYAATALTLADEPIYKLGKVANVCLDVFLGAILVWCLYLAHKYSKAAEGVVLFVSIGVAWAISFWLSRFYILWPDFLFVIPAFLLHSSTHDILSSAFDRVKSLFSRRKHPDEEAQQKGREG